MTEQLVTSADGTQIAWSRQGSGPPLVMVHCVAVSRATTRQPTLPSAPAEHFTVYTYDRRGTGGSGNTAPYSVDREFDDLAAVMAFDGRDAVVYGFSSGATLALLAAEAGVPIRSLVLLEPPLFDDPDPAFSLRDEAQRRIDADLADAHHWFDTEVVGVPEEVLARHTGTPFCVGGNRNTSCGQRPHCSDDSPVGYPAGRGNAERYATCAVGGVTWCG